MSDILWHPFCILCQSWLHAILSRSEMIISTIGCMVIWYGYLCFWPQKSPKNTTKKGLKSQITNPNNHTPYNRNKCVSWAAFSVSQGFLCFLVAFPESRAKGSVAVELRLIRDSISLRLGGMIRAWSMKQWWLQYGVGPPVNLSCHSNYMVVLADVSAATEKENQKLGGA